MSDPCPHGFLIRFCPSGVVNASESMPFRLPARCGAVTRSGAQCAINAGSALRDSSESLYILLCRPQPLKVTISP